MVSRYRGAKCVNQDIDSYIALATKEIWWASHIKTCREALKLTDCNFCHSGFCIKDACCRSCGIVSPTCDNSYSGNGKDYRGCVSKTKSGKTCQKWTSQSPNEHSRTPQKYPTAGLGDHNYCRNPDGEDGIWCYVADGSSRWEYCETSDDDHTSNVEEEVGSGSEIIENTSMFKKFTLFLLGSVLGGSMLMYCTRNKREEEISLLDNIEI